MFSYSDKNLDMLCDCNVKHDDKSDGDSSSSLDPAVYAPMPEVNKFTEPTTGEFDPSWPEEEKDNPPSISLIMSDGPPLLKLTTADS